MLTLSQELLARLGDKLMDCREIASLCGSRGGHAKRVTVSSKASPVRRKCANYQQPLLFVSLAFILVFPTSISNAQPSPGPAMPATTNADVYGELPDADTEVAHNPNFAPAYEDRGLVKMRLGDLDGALADFSHAIELSPKNGSFYTDRAEAYTKKGKLENAVADYEKVVQVDPQYVDSFMNGPQPEKADANVDSEIAAQTAGLQKFASNSKQQALIFCVRGNYERTKGDYEAAIADYTNSIALNSTDPEPYTDRAWAKTEKGDLDGALEDENKSLSIDPKNALSLVTRGELKLRQHDYDGAIADFTQATVLVPTQFDPTNTIALLDRAYAKHQKGELKEAVDDYVLAISPPVSSGTGMKSEVADATKKVEESPQDPWALAGRAGTKEVTGDIRGAIDDYTKAIALDPQNAKKANSYFFDDRAKAAEKVGDKIGAKYDFDEAILLSPDRADVYFERGNSRLKQGDFRGAQDDFDKAISIDGSKDRYFSVRADAKAGLHDFVGAIADYDQAITLSPKEARFYTGRGEVKDKEGDSKGAVVDYTQAIALDPENGTAYAYRGRAEAVSGDWNGAIADCDKAIEWSPALAIAYYYRGLAKENKGDRDGAATDYNAAIAHARGHGGSLPALPSPPKQGAEKKVMLGTGFFITSSGYLLTDNHVVDGASTIRVKVSSGIVNAVLVAADATDDIALLKVDGTYPCLPLGDSDSVSLGETVFTIGFPEPELQGLSPKFTKGEISSTKGIKDDPKTFQISVPVQPGNSGGCLVNETGSVVGLIESTLSTVTTAQASGDLLQNVNYATKINLVKKLLSSVLDMGATLAPPNAPSQTSSDKIKAVSDSTVFIIADTGGTPLPSKHLYTDSSGHTYSVSDADYQRLYPVSVALDTESKKVDQLNRASDEEAQKIERDRQTLDSTDQAAVDAFNSEVDRHNKVLDQIKEEAAKYNDAADQFNSELKRVGTLVQ